MRQVWKSLLFFVVVTPVLIALSLTLMDVASWGKRAWGEFSGFVVYVYVIGLVLFISAWIIDITARS